MNLELIWVSLATEFRAPAPVMKAVGGSPVYRSFAIMVILQLPPSSEMISPMTGSTDDRDVQRVFDLAVELLGAAQLDTR